MRSAARRRLAPAVAFLSAGTLAAALSGCVTRSAAPSVPAPAPAARAAPSPHRGQPFDVIPGESRLIVLVYRAGPMAALGHNHVIACRCIAGTLYLPRDPLDGSFELRIPVERLTVDDPQLRAAEHSAAFPPVVPPSARQGTRHNMLGAALLDAARYPQIVLRAEGLRPASDGKPDEVIAKALIEVRGRSRSIGVPVRLRIQAGRIVASGEFSLRQTALGLTPFRVMAGALRVRNTIRVRFRLVAKRRG
jgi:polyisoprenoid-binding protein YceI